MYDERPKGETDFKLEVNGYKVLFDAPFAFGTPSFGDNYQAEACVVECPRLWRITKNSLHNEGIYK